MHRIAASLAILALSSTTASAKCAVFPIVARVIPPPSAGVPADGGIVVWLTYGKFDERGKTASAEQKGWRFKVGNATKTPTIHMLAPGLAVYELPDAKATLVDDAGKSLATATRGKAGAALAAPKLTAAREDTRDDGPRNETSTRLEVDLDKRPANVEGLIVYVADKPIAWTSVQRDATTVTAYEMGGHCANDMPDFGQAPAGTKITVAWFDATGRVSPKSKEITVAKKRP